MAGLKLWTGKRKQRDALDQAKIGTEAAIKLTWQQPKRQHRFGRQIAFAFDDEAVQMAAASHFGNRVSLLNVRKTYIPRSFDSEDSRSTFLQGAIREYVNEFGGRYPVISVSVDGPETALRTLLMPELSSRELAAAVSFEGKRQLPFPIEDCLFDSRTIQKLQSAGERKLKVAVLAATKKLVRDRLAPFQQLGLAVDRVYHAQDVIGQLLPALPHFSRDTDYALINVQRTRSEISYYHGSNLAFFHLSSLGSSFLSNRTDPTMFEYFAESLATEIQNSLDYYAGQYSSQFSNQIFVYGDLAYSDELIGKLTDRFGLTFLKFPADLLSFVHRHNLEFEDTLPVCLPVVAAAISRGKLADLLPREEKTSRATRTVNRLGWAATVTATALLTIAWLSQISQVKTANDDLSGLQQEVDKFRASEMFATYNHLKRSIALSQSYINKAKESPSYLNLSLKELSRLTPAPVRLQVLDFRAGAGDRNLNLSGVVFTTETPPELALAELVENLEGSPFYANVQVDRNVKKRLPQGFELEFHVSMEGTI